MNKKEILAYNLKFLRKTKNITQTDAANIFGIKRATYASYEENRSIPNVFVFMDICEYYKIEPKKILTKKLKLNYE